MSEGPYRVCFVCTGNICRSPMAEAVFRARAQEAGLADAVCADSAGTGGWHAGEPADPRTVAVLAAAGYGHEHRARQFTADWFTRRELVVALDQGHRRALRAMAPSAADAAKVRLLRAYDPQAVADGELDVPDPYFGGAQGFDACLELITSAMPGLVAAVASAVGPAAHGAPER